MTVQIDHSEVKAKIVQNLRNEYEREPSPAVRAVIEAQLFQLTDEVPERIVSEIRDAQSVGIATDRNLARARAWSKVSRKELKTIEIDGWRIKFDVAENPDIELRHGIRENTFYAFNRKTKNTWVLQNDIVGEAENTLKGLSNLTRQDAYAFTVPSIFGTLAAPCQSIVCSAEKAKTGRLSALIR